MIYIYTFFSLIIIDSIWLFSMGGMYKTWIGHLFADKVSFLPAGIFYIIYTFGLVYLVISPALKGGLSLKSACISAMIFGFVAYATYDLTNHSTLKNWPVIMTVVDVLWGTVLTGVSCLLAMTVYKYFR